MLARGLIDSHRSSISMNLRYQGKSWYPQDCFCNSYAQEGRVAYLKACFVMLPKCGCATCCNCPAIYTQDYKWRGVTSAKPCLCDSHTSVG